MPLQFAPEPHNGSTVVKAGMDNIEAQKPTRIAARALTPMQLKSPHPVYDLRADAIAKGEGLASAEPTGFRYIVDTAGEPSGAAEVHTDSTGQATQMVNVNYGPYVESTKRAFAALPNLPNVASGNFEVRLLRCAAIQLMAIWLKATGGGTDVIYPLAPAPPVIEPEKEYTPDQFLKAITPLAQQRSEEHKTIP